MSHSQFLVLFFLLELLYTYVYIYLTKPMIKGLVKALSKLSEEYTVTLYSEQSTMTVPLQLSKAWLVCPSLHTVSTASFSTSNLLVS